MERDGLFPRHDQLQQAQLLLVEGRVADAGLDEVDFFMVDL